MPSISEEEKLRRQRIVRSVTGTNAMEGIEPDAATQALFDRYKSGELTLEEFSSAMDAHAHALVAACRPMAGVA